MEINVRELLQDCHSIGDYLELIDLLKRTLTEKELTVSELSMQVTSLNGMVGHQQDSIQEWKDKANYFKDLIANTTGCNVQ